MLRQTPFHGRTAPLCQGQDWRRWAGYAVASAYELSHEREYYAIRTSAALIDVSPLYKYSISGPDACALLNRIMTRDVSRCATGQVMYTCWCDDDGKVMDDGTVTRLEDDSFRMTSGDSSLAWLHHNAVGMDVDVTDISDRMVALSLQGPNSRKILCSAATPEVGQLRYFRSMESVIGHDPVTITRTGYTGDLGYEIWMSPDNAVSIWDRLISEGGAFGLTPVGMLAMDIARIEAGLLLIDVDYVPARKARIDNQKSSPFELGLGWMVDLKKESFIGHEALREEAVRPSGWRLYGLEVDWDSLEALYDSVHLPPTLPGRAWRTSVPVYRGSRQTGYATSGCWSPLLKRYIALAHILGEHARVGSDVQIEITIEHTRRLALARLVKTPFFNPPRKRTAA